MSLHAVADTAQRTPSELILSRVSWAKRTARRVALKNGLPDDIEDIEATALETLVRCANKADPARYDTFDGYLKRRIEGAVIDHGRVSRGRGRPRGGEPDKGRGKRIPRDHLRSYDMVRCSLLFSQELTPAEALERKQARQNLDAMLTKLPERLGQVVRWYYLHDLGMKEIGRRLGVTESRICQMLKEGIGRLRGMTMP